MKMIRTQSAAFLAILVFMSTPAMALSPCFERKIVSSPVSLQGVPPENHFYFRAESDGGTWGAGAYVLYLAPPIAVRYIGDRRMRTAPWEVLLPLATHTDVYQPILQERSFRETRRMRGAIADAIQNGDVALWSSRKGFHEFIFVEKYNEGCASGRIFKDSDGNTFYHVVDTIS